MKNELYFEDITMKDILLSYTKPKQVYLYFVCKHSVGLHNVCTSLQT